MENLPLRAQVRLRWGVAICCGIVAGGVVAPVLGIAAGLLAGWAVLALLSTAWLLLQVWSMDAVATRQHATAEDPGRRLARLLATAGSVASLAAVLVVMLQAQHTEAGLALPLAATALLSVVASWLLIQTDYMLRYAALYYYEDETGTPARGIDFNQEEPPVYVDFAYFSVGLGMTYQVSDTNVTRTGIRRVVIAQTVLGYLFGTGIIATVINLVTSLA